MRFFVLLIFAAVTLAACGSRSDEASGGERSARPLITPAIADTRPKIIAFGDSLTAGFGLAEKESYPYLLQQRLNAEGFKYEVVNAGVSGDTSLGGLERADWVFDQENVAIVVLELGANDLLRGLPPAKMKENLGKIIAKAKQRNIKVLLCGMLAPPTMGSDYQQQFVSAFPELAKEHNVSYLPFLLEGVALNKDLNQADGIHPNAEGTKLMTDNIFKALKPMLGS